ncbi:MAG: hypothetical protein ACRDJ4_04375 [Actinomycetota bacterium]
MREVLLAAGFVHSDGSPPAASAGLTVPSVRRRAGRPPQAC